MAVVWIPPLILPNRSMPTCQRHSSTPICEYMPWSTSPCSHFLTLLISSPVSYITTFQPEPTWPSKSRSHILTSLSTGCLIKSRYRFTFPISVVSSRMSVSTLLYRVFVNHRSCTPFAKFISDTILQRLASGAISVWRHVDEVEPAHLLMPLNVEPSKLRLCTDNCFLNLWSRDQISELQPYALSS